MDKLWVVIKREYIERVRTKWFVFVTLFGPIFFAAIMIVPGYLSVRGMQDARVNSVRIVDATGAGLGYRVAEKLVPAAADSSDAAVAARDSALTYMRSEVREVAPATLAALEDSLVADVMAQRLTGYLILDSATMAGTSARYAGRNASSVGENEQIENAVRAALLESRIESAGIDAATAESLSRVRVRLAAERITDEGKGGSGLAGAIFGFAIAFLLYMSIIFYGQAILRGVLEEKTTRVAEVVMSSVTADTLLAGKVIGVGAVGLTQQLTWVASGVLFWKLRGAILSAIGAPGMPSFAFPAIEPAVLIALVLFFLLGYTLYAALFAAVGAMVGSQEEANQASQPVMMLLVFSIIFVQPVMMDPTSTLANVMSLIPFSAPIIMPVRMSATQVPGVEIAGSLLGVALACVACIWLAARIYRIGLLMYGKRPSLRELARWVRQS
ncbi:MAG TPA: ABC transporter permease [Gemmatimonadaceae bacterium]|nr:ABC transporter permease [Gemmatimonadaceae bacterium]